MFNQSEKNPLLYFGKSRLGYRPARKQAGLASADAALCCAAKCGVGGVFLSGGVSGFFKG